MTLWYRAPEILLGERQCDSTTLEQKLETGCSLQVRNACRHLVFRLHRGGDGQCSGAQSCSYKRAERFFTCGRCCFLGTAKLPGARRLRCQSHHVILSWRRQWLPEKLRIRSSKSSACWGLPLNRLIAFQSCPLARYEGPLVIGTGWWVPLHGTYFYFWYLFW